MRSAIEASHGQATAIHQHIGLQLNSAISIARRMHLRSEIEKSHWQTTSAGGTQGEWIVVYAWDGVDARSRARRVKRAGPGWTGRVDWVGRVGRAVRRHAPSLARLQADSDRQLEGGAHRLDGPHPAWAGRATRSPRGGGGVSTSLRRPPWRRTRYGASSAAASAAAGRRGPPSRAPAPSDGPAPQAAPGAGRRHRTRGRIAPPPGA